MSEVLKKVYKYLIQKIKAYTPPYLNVEISQI